MDKQITKRTVMSVAGVAAGAVSVGMFKLAAFGVDPFQTLMSGLDALVPIEFGTLYVIANAVLLLFSLVFNRHLVGLATFINLFLLGYGAQFTLEVLQSLFPAPSAALRLTMLTGGIIITCLGGSLYMTADLGVSTYDAVAITLHEKWNLGKFKYMRILTDFVCVAAGCLLLLLAGEELREIPATAGIGTIITAFFMGPLIDFFNRKVSEPLLR